MILVTAHLFYAFIYWTALLYLLDCPPLKNSNCVSECKVVFSSCSIPHYKSSLHHSRVLHLRGNIFSSFSFMLFCKGPFIYTEARLIHHGTP